MGTLNNLAVPLMLVILVWILAVATGRDARADVSLGLVITNGKEDVSPARIIFAILKMGRHRVKCTATCHISTGLKRGVHERKFQILF